MKPEAKRRHVTGTLTGTRIAMGIDADSLVHIMDLLTDLYGNPRLAIIREYSTNAYDAHVEAGVKRPIEVSLPTDLAPFFRVRDYGFGLNEDDIRNVYSQYGASTRRDSNDVVGSLGLGSKSGLTYSDQFTVIGIKNGISTQVSVSRDADNGSTMTIVDVSPTDAPSGVEIVIPTKRWDNFRREARDFFRFWQPGTVLVDGAEPTCIDGIWISDDLLLTRETNESYVVMGNVPYPVPSGTFSDVAKSPVVAFVNIGAVTFTPSREALQMTPNTKATLSYLVNRVKNEKKRAFEAKIGKAATRADAINEMLGAWEYGYSGEPKWKGEIIPSHINLPTLPEDAPEDAPKPKPFIMVDVKKGWGHRGWATSKSIAVELLPTTIWLTGYEFDGLTSYKRKKLEQWKRNNPALAHVKRYMLVDVLPDTQWIDPSSVFPWSEPEAEKLQRETRQDGRVVGSYVGYVDGSWSRDIQAAKIDTNYPVLWTASETSAHNTYLWVGRQTTHYTLAVVPINRQAKFKRMFPMAQDVHSYSVKLAKKWQRGLTRNQRIALALHSNSYGFSFKKLDPDKVIDPNLKKVVRIARKDNSKLFKRAQMYNRFLDGEVDAKWVNPTEQYPLLTLISDYDTMTYLDQVYVYVNAVYTAEQEKV